MAIKYINGIIVTESALRQKSAEVTEITSDVEKCIDELKKQMLKRPKSQGISAIQIGFPYKIAVTRIDNVIRVMINLEFSYKFWFQFSNEGCESLIEERYGLWRPRFGKCHYLDENMVEHELKLNKKTVRVIAHEIDHFNGVLIKDKGRRWKFDTKTRGHYLSKRRSI